MYVCLSVCLQIYLSGLCLSVCLPVCISMKCLSSCLSGRLYFYQMSVCDSFFSQTPSSWDLCSYLIYSQCTGGEEKYECSIILLSFTSSPLSCLFSDINLTLSFSFKTYLSLQVQYLIHCSFSVLSDFCVSFQGLKGLYGLEGQNPHRGGEQAVTG